MSVVRLSESQWSDILSRRGEADAGSPSGTGDPIGSGDSIAPDATKRAERTTRRRSTGRRVAYVVGLEADQPNAEWSVFQRSIDKLVQSFQPSPVMTHVELVMPPSEEGLPPGTSPDLDPHINFATYLGRKANWGTTFENAEDFYLGKNYDAWRATPVVAWDAPERLREVCHEHHVGTNYAPGWRLYNYPFSIPPLRSVAWTIDDTAKAPAHCAALTARCLKHAIPETDLPNSSAWYGPSTLFLEMARKSRMRAYMSQLDDEDPRRTAEDIKASAEDAAIGENALLRGSDLDVQRLTQLQCHLGTEQLARKGIEATLNDDPTMARMWQKHLGKALMKWAHVRGGLSDADMATILAADGEAYDEE